MLQLEYRQKRGFGRFPGLELPTSSFLRPSCVPALSSVRYSSIHIINYYYLLYLAWVSFCYNQKQCWLMAWYLKMICKSHIIDRSSLVAQLVKNLPAMHKTWVWSLGWKIPWRMERLPTPVFWPGEFHGLCSTWGSKESDMTEWLSLYNR